MSRKSLEINYFTFASSPTNDMLIIDSLQVDVINMSYGEYSHWSNTGRVGDLMHEVINKYGVVWVASAGNNGPALCTVGTPPDIATNTVIGKLYSI